MSTRRFCVLTVLFQIFEEADQLLRVPGLGEKREAVTSNRRHLNTATSRLRPRAWRRGAASGPGELNRLEWEV
jgi:hypothetical protein